MKQDNNKIKINLFFNSGGLSIKEILELDFSDFLSKYFKKRLS